MSHKIDIDFSVFSNPYFLKIMDLSAWGNIKEQPAIIEITLPGYESCLTRTFDKCKTNVLNSVLLGINCVDESGKADNLSLPDGIYKFRVIGSPSTYFKEYYYLKTDMYDLEVDKIYINNLNQKNRDGLINTLAEMDFLVEGAKAHLRHDDINTAGAQFQKAQEMVEDLKNCRDCNKDNK